MLVLAVDFDKSSWKDDVRAFAETARLLDISAAIIERATDLRGKYGFRSPDAIHLAAAIDCSADVFVTGDAALARCTEIAVDVLSP